MDVNANASLKRTAIPGTLLGLALVLALSGCGSQATPVKPTPTAAPVVPGAPSGDRIIAEGRVIPVKSAELDLAAAGIVTEVLVAEGDKVKKDQPLLRVDARRQAAAVAQAEAALAGAKATQARAQAAQSRAQAALAQLKAGARAEDVAVARAAVQVAEAELARVRLGADKSTLIAAQATMDKAARAVQQAQYAYDRAKDAGSGSSAEALRLEQATIDYDAAKAQYAELGLLPRPADVSVALGRVAQAQAALALVQAGARPEAVKAAEADVAAADAEAGGAAAGVAAAEAAVAQAKVALADCELRAPFDGAVSTLNVKVGEAAPVGGFALRLADMSAWLVETTDLTELSIARVSQGTAVALTFDAIPGLELPGKVARIKLYGESRQGDVVYTVLVTPDLQDARLRWNMTSKVSIEVK